MSVQPRLPAPGLPDWLERQLPFRRYRVQIEGLRLHVQETGDGPAVLLLHGNPTWSFLYRRVATALADAPLRVILPDLIGLGLSDKPRAIGAHTLANHARWIGALLDALALDRVVFVGHDWGGPIGLAALARTPERLAGLVLTNTVAGPPKPGHRATAFHRFARWPLLSTFVFRWLGFPQCCLWLAQADRRSLRGEVARAYRWPLRRPRDRTAPLALARMVPVLQDHPSIAPLEAARSFVAGFGGPAALVWGERDPILGRLLRRHARILPQASVDATPAGHFLQEEVPDAVAAAIRRVAGEAYGGVE